MVGIEVSERVIAPGFGLPCEVGALVLGWVGRPGGDLLSRALRHSTMGAGDFHGRVRDGIGCIFPRNSHQVIQDHSWVG